MLTQTIDILYYRSLDFVPELNLNLCSQLGEVILFKLFTIPYLLTALEELT